MLAIVLHRCPYYRTAEQNLYGRLLSVSSDTDTKYWSALAGATLDISQCDSGFVQVTPAAWQAGPAQPGAINHETL